MAAKRDGGGSSKKKSAPKQTWTPPKGMPQVKPQGKPTEAITAKGQQATGLAKSSSSDRFASKAKTPVKQAGKGFAGSGSPVGTSLKLSQPTKASNVVNAALAVTALPGSGQVRSAVAKALGKKAGIVGGKVAAAAEGAAWRSASKGLGASGAGGKVSKTFTPFGQTLRSTAIGTPKQQAARMSGLTARAANITTAVGVAADRATARARQEAIRSTLKAFSKATKVGRGSATIYVGSKTKPKKKK